MVSDVDRLPAAVPAVGASGGASPGPVAGTSVAELILHLAAVELDDSAREAARLRVVDTLFAIAVGRRTGQGRAGAALADELYGADSVAGCAYRLAAACRMTEIDDVDLRSCTTPGSVVVPTVLAVLGSSLAAHPASADHTLDVVARGYEIAIGLGEAMSGPHRLATGVWPTLAVAAVTAAAVTALLVGGDGSDVERAVVAASQQSVDGNPRGTAREQLLAAAVVTGIGSAFAGRRGFAVLGSRGGGALGRLVDWPLQPSWRPRVERPAVKAFCSARQAMTSVAALRQALDGARLPVEDHLRRIDVEVPHEYAAMIDKSQVLTRRDSIASVAYQLALTIRRPAGLLDVGRDDLGSDELRPLMALVRVRGSDTLSARYPDAWPARVRLTTDEGVSEATADHVPGEDDLTPDSLSAKMRDFSVVSPDLEEPAEALRPLAYGGLPLDAHHLLPLLDVLEDEPRFSPVSTKE